MSDLNQLLTVVRPSISCTCCNGRRPHAHWLSLRQYGLRHKDNFLFLDLSQTYFSPQVAV